MSAGVWSFGSRRLVGLKESVSLIILGAGMDPHTYMEKVGRYGELVIPSSQFQSMVSVNMMRGGMRVEENTHH